MVVWDEEEEVRSQSRQDWQSYQKPSASCIRHSFLYLVVKQKVIGALFLNRIVKATHPLPFCMNQRLRATAESRCSGAFRDEIVHVEAELVSRLPGSVMIVLVSAALRCLSACHYSYCPPTPPIRPKGSQL